MSLDTVSNAWETVSPESPEYPQCPQGVSARTEQLLMALRVDRAKHKGGLQSRAKSRQKEQEEIDKKLAAKAITVIQKLSKGILTSKLLSQEESMTKGSASGVASELSRVIRKKVSRAYHARPKEMLRGAAAIARLLGTGEPQTQHARAKGRRRCHDEEMCGQRRCRTLRCRRKQQRRRVS